MTIHHDKLAYGKLASMRETVSQDRIEEMLQKLKPSEREQDKSDAPETDTSGKKKD